MQQYDAIIIGSGPNGLAAAITLQQQGLAVLVLEAKPVIGGGMRTAELTLPGFRHDVCSAVHPMAIHSPFLSSLPLDQYGLEYIHAPVAAAHPLDNGLAAFASGSLEETAAALGADQHIYEGLVGPVVKNWDKIAGTILGPLRFPGAPVELAKFGWNALKPASLVAKRFKTAAGRALWAGMAAHSIQPLSNIATAAIGLVLTAAAHKKGWPIPRGGSRSIADAMAAYFIRLGGRIETDQRVSDLNELPPAKALLFDVTPRQLLAIAGQRLSAFYKWQLEHYRYGMGVFKIDWALKAPIPFTAAACRQAMTVHIGGSFEEIAAAEYATSKGRMVDRPFVLLSQQSLFDPTRAPEGRHTAWAYCHVPNGSQEDRTIAIEDQVERFAPGFRDLILARHTMNTAAVEAYNPNYIGGDINGGIIDIRQLYTRPSFRVVTPYRTSDPFIYICSSSTPPGGGVHGMCGFHAAKAVLKNLFNIKL